MLRSSILPPNATLLERVLEGATARIGDVEAPIAPLVDPWTCRMEHLPWLAWGFSVDSWDADWSEATKRAAVADSIALHRLKGTRLSVEAVLRRFDDLVQLVEWHEATPRGAPHTFEILLPMVTAAGSAPGGTRASAAFADAIIREVARVKPLREHLTLVQSLTAAGAVGIQGVARAANFDRREAAMTIDTSPAWAAYLQTEDGEPIEDPTGFLDTAP
jgi:phage tail P2-like protein